MKRLCLLIGIALGELTFITAAIAQPSHPWRPPFGLDRIGTQEVDTGIEADAIARPDPLINPVDLGTILVPHDWLLLRPGQVARVAVAAISHSNKEPDARLKVWFASRPEQAARQELMLPAGQRVDVELAVESIPAAADHDELHVRIERADGTQLWEKSIHAMLVATPPDLPEFGAVRLKLRYDLPISVRHADGTFSTLDYEQGWDESLDDVVVCLPGGQRFVFWRGSSYIPFWAGTHNTGLCYEWAETKPPADGFKDCVEPLMDKELRYSRVEILESTAARIHVRWTYQSCDFEYKVWGDAAVEDYYFYPDGFGTRILTLQSTLDSEYELSEFIILTPPGAYPFSVLEANLVDIIFLDGQKRTIEFPYDAAEQSSKLQSRDMPAVYRVRMRKDDTATAIYFHPTDVQLPPVVFAGFLDQGEVVTPCYWGSHWPLARGQTTGGKIDDRIHLTPSHNSIMSWAMQQPQPLRESQLITLDTLGRSKPMRRQTWAWMIGLTDDSDEQLLARAGSFGHPPDIQVEGGRLADEPYTQERRAIAVVAEAPALTINLEPKVTCVNPVFEVASSSGDLQEVRIDSDRLSPRDWRWDGSTLWINRTLPGAASIQLKFESAN